MAVSLLVLWELCEARPIRGLSVSSNSHLENTRGYQVGPIVQTLTLAIILLVIGLTCMVLGITGLMWKAGWDRRRKEKAANALTSDEFSPTVSPVGRRR